ncbi:unnamed protein product, partial [marine sediment metagenome]
MSRLTYVLRKPAGEGKYYVICLLEHLRYSGDAVLSWIERDNCFDVLMVAHNSLAHERQIHRAYSFGFLYAKTKGYTNQIPDNLVFQ